MSRSDTTAGLTGAAILTAVALPLAPGVLQLARIAILGGALGVIVLHDLREHRIPNRIVLPAAGLCGALLAIETAKPTAGLYLAAAIVLVLLLVSLLVPAALGMGDVKLSVLILCALGSQAPTAIYAGLILAAVVGVALRLARGASILRTSIPLAPMLAAGCAVALLA